MSAASVADVAPALATMDANTLMVVQSRWQWAPRNALTCEELEQQLLREHEFGAKHLDDATWPRVDEARIAKHVAKEAVVRHAIEAINQARLAKKKAQRQKQIAKDSANTEARLSAIREIAAKFRSTLKIEQSAFVDPEFVEPYLGRGTKIHKEDTAKGSRLPHTGHISRTVARTFAGQCKIPNMSVKKIE